MSLFSREAMQQLKHNRIARQQRVPQPVSSCRFAQVPRVLLQNVVRLIVRRHKEAPISVLKEAPRSLTESVGVLHRDRHADDPVPFVQVVRRHLQAIFRQSSLKVHRRHFTERFIQLDAPTIFAVPAHVSPDPGVGGVQLVPTARINSSHTEARLRLVNDGNRDLE